MARAQSETLLLDPSIPDGFDKGRNVAVTDRSRPDYDPLGVRVRDFILYPQVSAGIGFSDNVFLSSTSSTPDGFGFVAPSIRAQSDWSRNELQFRGGGEVRRFFTQPRRNEDSFNFGGLGRLEILSAYSVTAEAQVAKLYETPFSGELQSNLSVLSSYYRSFFSVRGQYQAGQVRATLVADRTAFSFNSLPVSDSVSVDQSDRDRHISRLTAQGEYAWTPSVSSYFQAAYSDTSYSNVLRTGVPNRDSEGYRLIGGFNLDLSGFLRGTIGVGYVWRHFDNSNLYPALEGISAEAKLQYFLSELTTFSLIGRRTIEDSSISTTSGYFDNRVILRADHELLRNLLVNATGEYAHEDYVGALGSNDVYRFSGGARYLVSHVVALEGQVSYGGQTTSQTALGRQFNEFRTQIGVVLKR